MAYTASALAFLLRGLGKPVIVTGSQIPLGVLRSDGRQNLLTAILVAARDDVREVCLVFGSPILRGCRSVKASAPARGGAGDDRPADDARRAGGDAPRLSGHHRGDAARRDGAAGPRPGAG